MGFPLIAFFFGYCIDAIFCYYSVITDIEPPIFFFVELLLAVTAAIQCVQENGNC